MKILTCVRTNSKGFTFDALNYVRKFVASQTHVKCIKFRESLLQGRHSADTYQRYDGSYRQKKRGKRVSTTNVHIYYTAQVGRVGVNIFVCHIGVTFCLLIITNIRKKYVF